MAYTKLYNEYLLGEATLDKNLNIVKNTSTDIGSLIILTGNSSDATDELYRASQKLSATYYKEFSKRGFTQSDIYWINANSAIDIDNDGVVDNVVDDTNVTVANFFNTIDKESQTNKKGPLYIYMVDHGSNGSFKIAPGEILYAKALKSKLDDFISKTSRDIVVIIEACKSGSFIPILTDNYTNDKIAVITSSEAGKLSYIDSFGGVSFTKFLSESMLSGKPLYRAFKDSKKKLLAQGSVYSSQVPQSYIPTDTLKNLRVGGSFAAASMDLTSIDSYKIDGEDNATISSINLVDKNTISIEAKITSGSGIKRVWATIIPPDYTPPSIADGSFKAPNLDKYTVPLSYDESSKTYKAIYTIPTESTYSGIYDISIYAEDNDGLVNSVNKKIEGYGTKDYMPVNQTDTNATLSLSKGWNLVAADIKKYNLNSDIVIFWQYNNNRWSAYSPNQNIQNIITKNSSVIDVLKNIKANKGTWILCKKDTNISIEKTTIDISYINYSYGWNLAGTVKDINVDDITCKDSQVKSIWKYNNHKWMLHTDVTNPYNLEDFDTLNAHDGFWVDCE